MSTYYVVLASGEVAGPMTRDGLMAELGAGRATAQSAARAVDATEWSTVAAVLNQKPAVYAKPVVAERPAAPLTSQVLDLCALGTGVLSFVGAGLLLVSGLVIAAGCALVAGIGNALVMHAVGRVLAWVDRQG